MHTQFHPERRVMSTMPPEFRHPPSEVTAATVAAAKRAAAKEALEALCVNYADAFQVLLHRDRLTDRFGSLVLDEAFNDILADRRFR